MPSLVQIMVCRLFGDNPLFEPMMVYGQLDPKEHISVKVFIQENAFEEVVCKNGAILSWPCS